MKITDSKYVTLTYDLNVGEGDERELMEQATPERPLEFIFGTNSMLKAFEDNIYGLSEGDSFKFSLTPDEAYGDYDETRIIDLPKSIFEVDGKIDHQMLFEGNTLPMMDSDGNRLTGSVVSITEDTVTMDFNHPLAGETMHFEGVIQGVRDASPEEIAALFSGGGCGCGNDSCGCGDEGDSCGCGSGDGGCGGGCSC
ncbi:MULTISPECIES: FKBP-type peptidyl-prolyl cis-trans isomerase [Petrimonas]|jgi:FKBP-type peptidyl-prolyl cis-trans isomerase SlyD|uniref:Peptidyl-prolyl cis-trans isomerase n=1 Tax=Petrimonas mucosa TaxID=1642646 RepID=A0A1G4G997_9BACT|nr:MULTISPECIES: FKBP-type peptidyl-prolyl cis-trans isomerase [Petrimonas]SCM59088.1 FKBP-type peptidyl-prolyl cis-trans isomerase SlyD [Petrimonas mucosa]SFU54829.1 FKBP-type peptidyl-prolyl cis-trans isomerase SlyD [Porphyromonadaceae bacterium KHP3R9]